jgi:hypothetical protein
MDDSLRRGNYDSIFVTFASQVSNNPKHISARMEAPSRGNQAGYIIAAKAARDILIEDKGGASVRARRE